jgi:hypothetical protein
LRVVSTRETTAHRPRGLARWLDRLSGFDFFISYAHADAPDYAEALCAALTEQGFRAFLDKQVYVAGDELGSATLRRIEASSKLIVLIGPRALDSHWVLQEVRTAIDLNRPVIAIDPLGGLSEAQDNSELARLLRDRIHVREPDGLAAKVPSAQTLDALARSFQATRREHLQRTLALGGALFFALLAGLAYWQKTVADARYLAHKELCDEVVTRVAEGQQKIRDLDIGRFGELIADVANTLAELPDPEKDLKCTPEDG